MASDETSHKLGATLIVIPPNTNQIVDLSKLNRGNGGFFKLASGATLALVDNDGQTAAQGYILGAAEIISFDGPARFYLASGGATCTIMMGLSYSNYTGSTGLTL